MLTYLQSFIYAFHRMKQDEQQKYIQTHSREYKRPCSDDSQKKNLA